METSREEIFNNLDEVNQKLILQLYDKYDKFDAYRNYLIQKIPHPLEEIIIRFDEEMGEELFVLELASNLGLILKDSKFPAASMYESLTYWSLHPKEYIKFSADRFSSV